MKRKGIISAGNWIVDRIKLIDKYPEEGMLVTIREEYKSVGGGPNNVLVDLARMETGIPLFAAGLIGTDEDGDYILSELGKHEIDLSNMFRTGKVTTSRTDVMSVIPTGNRTFFHYRGANALFGMDHIKKIQCGARIFHLAYLLLLDQLDNPDPDYGVVAARILFELQGRGFETSVDVVSEVGQRFQKIVIPCLKYINYLIINEVEAEGITGITIRNADHSINTDEMKKAAELLIKKGVNSLVIIHSPETAVLLDSSKDFVEVPSFKMDPLLIKGSTGAGDAFCAGCLYGIHMGFDYTRILKIGHASARFNLTDPTSVGGAVSVRIMEDFLKKR